MMRRTPAPGQALLGTSALLLAGVAGCSSDPAGPRDDPRNFTVEEGNVSSANSAFGLRLLAQVHDAEREPNVFLSPLSASMALGMTLNGARGETLEAMRTTLGFGGMTESEINTAYAGLIGQLRARDRKVEFTLANSLWHERTFSVEQPFVQAAREHFKAEVRGLDFLDPRSARIISEWAEDATGGRIKDLLQSIDPLEKLFLVNAVYFKAPWAATFNPAATQNAPFRRSSGGTVQVRMMSRDGTYPHFQNAEAEGVELIYGDSAFSMVLIAPAESGSLDALIRSITSARWNGWMGALQPGRILLAMPKFRFDYGLKLDHALKTMGMSIAFVPRQADFSGINRERDDLHISRVEHKTFIDVHELGTEAAGATAVGVGITSLPPSLRFDRPFLFAIRERSSGTLLFIGRIGDPTAT